MLGGKRAAGIKGIGFNYIGEVELFSSEDGRTEGGKNRLVVEEVGWSQGFHQRLFAVQE